MAQITVSFLKDLQKKVAAGGISHSRMAEMLNEQAKLNQNNEFEFYKTKEDELSWKGERYFRFKWNSNEALQVCLATNNETKRGRGHYVGIYKISRVTLFSNWFPGHVEPCSKEEFNQAFDKVVKMLK